MVDMVGTLVQLAGSHYKACNMRACAWTNPGRKMFDDHFILIYQWWLPNEVIKPSPGPLKTRILPFLGHPKCVW